MPRSTARQTLAGITVTATAAALLALAPTSASAGLITTTLTSTTDVPLGGYADIASDGGAISVSDQGPAVPYPASTTFTGLQGAITDVNVTLKGITHGSPRDLDVLLVSPTGRMAVVLSDVGGFQTQVNDVDVRLDDEAASAVPAARPHCSPAPSGRRTAGTGDQFLGRGVPSDTPANLSVFDGDQANGTWELYIVDDNFDYTGRLNRGWEISVTTAGPAVYPSTIQAAGLPTGITDLDVALDGLTHTYPADVDLLLVGPGGQQATVLSDVGTEGVYDTDLVLDDEAPSELGQYAQPGRWRPTNHDGPDPFPAPAPTATGSSALSVFDTTDPNGTWRLYAVDDAAGFRGTLSGWSLTIQTEGPVPTSGGADSPTTGAGRPAGRRLTAPLREWSARRRLRRRPGSAVAVT